MEQRDRSTKEVMNDVKDHFSNLAGAEMSYEMTSSMGMSMSGADITVQLKGEELDSVCDTTIDLADKMRDVKGIEEITTDVEEGSPEIKIILDRTNAANYGITAYQLASALSGSLSGTTATDVTIDGETMDIVLSLSDQY